MSENTSDSKKKGYIIVSSTYVTSDYYESLESLVNYYIEKGYIPLGSPFVEPPAFTSLTRFHQAMILKE